MNKSRRRGSSRGVHGSTALPEEESQGSHGRHRAWGGGASPGGRGVGGCVPCCFMLYHAMMLCATPRYVVMYHSLSHQAWPCQAMPCYAHTHTRRAQLITSRSSPTAQPKQGTPIQRAKPPPPPRQSSNKKHPAPSTKTPPCPHVNNNTQLFAVPCNALVYTEQKYHSLGALQPHCRWGNSPGAAGAKLQEHQLRMQSPGNSCYVKHSEVEFTVTVNNR